jgi:hypothetical protein
MKENKDEVVKLSIESFIPWLEKRFNDKYESSLESLKERFVGIFTVFKIILEKTMEIDQILSEDVNDANVYSQYKPLLDNMIRLLDMMMKEFPECLDLEFVEFFFLSVQERIQIYLAHFHQFFHIHYQDPIVNNKISNFFYYIGKCTKIIDSAISLIPQSVIELQKRAELSVPLLKYIKDCKFMFRTPIKKLKEEIQVLSNDKSYEDFETVMEDVKNRSKGTMKFKMDFVNKMIDLVKEATQYQFEINKMLKPYFSMANAIKTKGKKFLNENLKSTDQAKLLKFVTLLLRPDFTNNVLPSLEINELAYIIKLLESQVSLVGEYRKSLVKGVEEFQLLKPVDFEVTLEKYKLVMTEMNSFQEFVQKNFEVTKFNKDTINQVIKDIKRVVDKYKEFQNGIYHYQEILELFNKVRNLTGKFCFSEFNLKVELICEYNL